MSDGDILFTLFMAWVTLIWICLNPESWIRLRIWLSSKVDQRSTTEVDPHLIKVKVEGDGDGEKVDHPNKLDRYV